MSLSLRDYILSHLYHELIHFSGLCAYWTEACRLVSMSLSLVITSKSVCACETFLGFRFTKM